METAVVIFAMSWRAICGAIIWFLVHIDCFCALAEGYTPAAVKDNKMDRLRDFMAVYGHRFPVSQDWGDWYGAYYAM